MASGRGKKDDKKEYESAAKADAAAIKPSEEELARNAETALWRKQIADGVDVKDLSGLKPHFNLYENAISDQMADRQSNGIFNLARGGNSGQAQAYDTYMKYKRQQDAAGQLETAFNVTDADMKDTGFQYAQLAGQRNLGKASLSQQALNSYLQSQAGKKSGWDKFKEIAGIGLQGGAMFGV